MIRAPKILIKFEYTYELYWKMLKIICTEAGYEVLSPRQALEQAYTLELIEQERIWIEIMRSDFLKLKARFGL